MPFFTADILTKQLQAQQRLEKYIAEHGTLPDPDEHYQMKMVGGEDTVMLAETVSQHGTQPGLWVSEYGKGRICCFTPAHTTPSLTCEGYVQIMKNAVTWCCRNNRL